MDKTDFIVGQAERLTIEERKTICKAILDTIERDVFAVDAQTRFNELLPKAEVAMEWRYKGTRKMNGDTYIRDVIARQMRTEGYSYTQIAAAMKRHRSSVYVMIQRADEMREGYFGNELKEKYNHFMQII